MRLPWQLGVFSTVLSMAICADGLTGTRPAVAQPLLSEQGELTTGDAILDDGSLYDQHMFPGSSGQQVTITLSSQDFDPYLILLDPQGRRISENDDISRDNLNSRLVITLPSTGQYTVVANSYEANKSGSYEITVSANGGVDVTQAAQAALPDATATCNTVLVNSTINLSDARDVAVMLKAIVLGDRYAAIPDARPDGVGMSLSGPATLSVMSSPQLMTRTARDVIDECDTVGAVVFQAAESGQERTFGFLPSATAALMPAEGGQGDRKELVEEFSCVAEEDSQALLNWGEQLCL